MNFKSQDNPISSARCRFQWRHILYTSTNSQYSKNSLMHILFVVLVSLSEKCTHTFYNFENEDINKEKRRYDHLKLELIFFLLLLLSLFMTSGNIFEYPISRYLLYFKCTFHHSWFESSFLMEFRPLYGIGANPAS